MPNKKIEQMKGKRMDLKRAFDRLDNKMHEFDYTNSDNKMNRKETESLINQVYRLSGKLDYWIKFPSSENEIWFCIRCGKTFKKQKVCPNCGSDEITFKKDD